MKVKDLSPAARYEVTKKHPTTYANTSKKNKDLILDQLVKATDQNRDHARQQLRRQLCQPPDRATGNHQHAS